MCIPRRDLGRDLGAAAMTGAEPAEECGEHRFEHRGGQFSSVGVEARAVIAVGEQPAVRQRVNGAVPKPEQCPALAECGQNRAVRDRTQRHKGAQPRRGRNLRGQKFPAIGDFTGFGFVLRRHAAHRVGDPCPDERQPVIRPGVVIALGEPEFVQGGIEQRAGMVAGKRPPGAVGAAQTRRQPDDQDFGAVLAKRRHRRVEPVRMRGPLGLAKRGEPRAARTVARRQCRRGLRCGARQQRGRGEVGEAREAGGDGGGWTLTPRRRVRGAGASPRAGGGCARCSAPNPAIR